MKAAPRWFTRVGYTESGPFTTESLQIALTSGSILGDVPVRREGAEQWCNFRNHPSFASDGADWVTHSAGLSVDAFANVPDWERKIVEDNASGFVLRFAPASPLPAYITVCVYRADERGPIPTGHDSLQALAAFLSAILSFNELEGPGRSFRSTAVERIDRISLGMPPGAPWALRALCRLSLNDEPSDTFQYQWLVLTAARDHYVKVIVSLEPTESVWRAVLEFLSYLGSVLVPTGQLSDTARPEPSAAEREQLGICRAILEHQASNPGEQIYLSFLIDQAQRLASMPGTDPNAIKHAGIRMAQFAEFLWARGNPWEGEAACVCAVELFRQLAEASVGAAATLHNLYQALNLLEKFAVARGEATDVASVREQLVVIEQLLADQPMLN